MGGTVTWIGIALFVTTGVESSELWVEQDGKVHQVFCLRGGGGGGLLKDKKEQPTIIERAGMNMVEVTFRGSKGTGEREEQYS